jgi:3-isopropylmalate dehydrogenase
MKAYKLVLLPGDGVGSEVMAQAKLILDTLSEIYTLNFELIERPCGFEYMQRTGKAWEEGTFELCRDTADAILLGAIGRPDNTTPLPVGEKSPGAKIVLGLRSQLDLYANVRPVQLFAHVQHKISDTFNKVWSPENVNMVIVRENTEGFYNQEKERQRLVNNNEVIDQRVITRKGSERVIKFAFDLANKRNGAPMDGKSRVTCVDKSNVLNGCRLFRQVFNSVAAAYPTIEPDYSYIDAFTQALLQKPEYFDVVVTTNLFGDIITDLAAVLQGGLGMAPSANLSDTHGLFEPVHGSAPDIAGKGFANPIAMILSTQMMLGWLGEKENNYNLNESSKALFNAVINYLKKGKSLPYDLGGNAKTAEVTKNIIKELKD